jgi:hypothetical protein
MLLRVIKPTYKLNYKENAMKTNLKKLNIFISALLFLALSMSLAMPIQKAAASGTLYVNNTVTCSDVTTDSSITPYCTITAAVGAAGVGDTINVATGTYSERNITINKSMTLLGDPGDSEAGPGPGAPVIDGGSLPGDAFKLANGISNVIIQGFEIRNYTSNDTGIGNGVSAWVGSTSYITIQDNYFHDLGYNAVLVGNDYNVNPIKWGDHTNWLIKGNNVANVAYIGFELTNTSNSVIEDNIIHLNSPVIGAIFSSARRSESGLTFQNNLIDGTPSSSFPVIYVYAYDLDMVSPNLDGLSILGNIISTVGTPFQVYVRNIGTGTITNIQVHDNSLSTLKNTTTATVDATSNWWGSASGPGTGAISGTVTYFPWYLDASMTGLSLVHNVTKDTYYATIQAAIDDANASGDVLSVSAATFIENLVVNKSVTITGAGQGSTIIQPAVSNPNCGGAGGGSLCDGASNVILVQADNVVIHDLSVDGDNPALSGGFDKGGANIDARNGIITNHALGIYNGLEVHHVTVQNIYLRGMYASSGGTFNFHHNTVTNVQAEYASIGMFAYGGGPGIMANNTISYTNDAISSNHSKGIQFLNNAVTHSMSGIHTDNAGDGGGVADLIQGNTVDCTGMTGAYGIWTFVPYIAPTVNNNTIINCNPGLSAWAQGAAVVPQFTNNTVTGDNSTGSTGIYITTDLISWGYSDISVNFTGNTITGFNYGIELEAGHHSWNPETYVAHTINATFSNNFISGNTLGLVEAVDSGVGGTYLASATPNWWGNASGPYNATLNPTGTGNPVVPTDVDFDPWCLNADCSDNTPPLPSSFYGYIHYYSGTPTGNVDAFVPGMTEAARSTAIGTYSGSPYYQMDVPGDAVGLSGKTGGVEGDLVTFKIGSRIVATHEWHSGTSVGLNFHPPESVPGGPYKGLVNASISLNGSVNDWLTPDTFTYAWDLDNTGSYETSGQNVSNSWSTVGTYTIGLQVIDGQHGEGTATTTVDIASITLTPGSLSAVYDGNQHAASATTNPTGLAVNFTYDDGSGPTTTAPKNAGSYIVVATIPGYTGSATGTLGISPATATISLSNLVQTVDGNPKHPTVVTVPAGLAYSVTYNGSSTEPSAAGVYTLVVTITDPNGNGSTTGTMYLQTTCTTSLTSGWNLISPCLAQVDPAETGTVLSSLNGKYDLVYGWDASTAINNWKKFAPGGPPFANDLTRLDEKMGFWIHMTQSATLTVTGYPPSATNISIYSVASGGWNLVGFPKASDHSGSGLTDMPGAFTEHDVNNFTLVYAFHAYDNADQWKLFDNHEGVPPFASDLNFLEPGWGYWVQATGTTQIWHVAY